MAKGFFNLGPPPKIETPSKAPKRIGCLSCGLDKSGKNEPFYGECKEGILVVGEYPKTSHELGSPFIGQTHAPFWQMEGSRQFSPDILRDMSLGFALPCPSKYMDSKNSECCRVRLMDHIEKSKPKVIIAMGPIAIKALIWNKISGRMKNTHPTDFIGHCIPDRELNAWIVPTYGMDHLASQWDQEGELRDRIPLMQFQSHLRQAWIHRNKKFPEIPDCIETSQDEIKAIQWIEEALGEAKEVSFDYETTSVKPQRQGNRIVSNAMSWKDPSGNWKCKAFPWFGNSIKFLDAWKRLMTSRIIGKLAHKNDFEIGWTRERAGLGNSKAEYWPINMTWDTCLAAHCINNEGKVGLKFLAYVHFGAIGYDSAIDRYITSGPESSKEFGMNAFNWLQSGKFNMQELIDYGAQDALYSALLRDIQATKLTDFQMNGFNLFMDGVMALSKCHSFGLPFNRNKALKIQDALGAELIELSNKIQPLAKSCGFVGDFNPGSPKQIISLLDSLQLYPDPKNKNAQEETLKKIDHPIVHLICRYQKVKKQKDTFLAGFIREAVWNEERKMWLIHPFFNLSSGSDDEDGGPRTLRGSSDSPNFQNIPKRDKESMKLLRSLFYAPPGWKIKEYDYKGVEVTGGACYHKDPSMIMYLTKSGTDMHRDTGMDLFFRDIKSLTKDERQVSKNGYVFPTFYGATPKSMGPSIWEDMPEATRQHIAKHGKVTYWDRELRKEVTVHGIKDLDTWMQHIKNVNKIFWGERFKVYAKWKEEEWARMQEHGYLELFTGFRCYGPVTFTSATNRRIQGSSFHILLQSLIWEIQDIESHGLQSMILGQIHDAKVCLVKDDEEAQMDSIIHANGVKRIRDVWKWIIVPLTIEVEASESGGTWAEMHDCGKLEGVPEDVV